VAVFKEETRLEADKDALIPTLHRHRLLRRGDRRLQLQGHPRLFSQRVCRTGTCPAAAQPTPVLDSPWSCLI
jgi:hypothetical protein